MNLLFVGRVGHGSFMEIPAQSKPVRNRAAQFILIYLIALSYTQAAPQVFNTSDSPFTPATHNQGWWSDVFLNYDANNNYAVGSTPPNIPGVKFRNFFTFDLRSLDLSGVVIVGVTLELQRYHGVGDPVETLVFYDVSTDARTLNNNNGNSAAIFEDLGTGRNYGAFDVSTSGAFTDVLSFPLNSVAIADITAARGTFFSIGGALESFSARQELLFEYSEVPVGADVQRLVITTAVPEPGTIGLLVVFGMGALILMRPATPRRQAVHPGQFRGHVCQSTRPYGLPGSKGRCL